MRKVLFDIEAFEEYNDWANKNIRLFNRIAKLIDECRRTPFSGTGKPEPLKHEFKGCWSRRINDEHRLIYDVTDEAIYIISCKGHYK